MILKGVGEFNVVYIIGLVDLNLLVFYEVVEIFLIIVLVIVFFEVVELVFFLVVENFCVVILCCENCEEFSLLLVFSIEFYLCFRCVDLKVKNWWL